MNAQSNGEQLAALQRWHLVTTLKSIAADLLVFALIACAMHWFRVSWHTIFTTGGMFYLGIGFAAWYFQDNLASFLFQATPASPKDSDNPRYQDILRGAHKAWSLTGTAYESPLYKAEGPPNAAYTGPFARKSKVIFMKGLMDLDLGVDGYTAVFAHEYGHRQHWDSLYLATLNMLVSILYLVFNTWFNIILGVTRFAQRHVGLKPLFALPAMLVTVLSYLSFYVFSSVMSVVQNFASRARESAADQYCCLITGQPCVMATSLFKLGQWYDTHRTLKLEQPLQVLKGLWNELSDLTVVPRASFQDRMRWQVLGALTTVDPLSTTMQSPHGTWESIKRWWHDYVRGNHPPIPDRIEKCEEVNGGICPTAHSRRDSGIGSRIGY